MQTALRELSHYVDGADPARGERAASGTSTNRPTGNVQARVPAGAAGRGGRRRRRRRAGRSRPGPRRRRPRRAAVLVRVPRADRGSRATGWPASITREHGKVLSDARRRGPARHGGGGVRLRHPELLKGEFTDQVGARRGQLLAAPAARRVRRHHAVQLPRHGAAVDVADRDRLRQHASSSSRREKRPVGLAVPGRADGGPGCRRACSTSCTATRRRLTRMLEHPGIAAVSFVGSTPIAAIHLPRPARAHGKRVQALGGAKNHMVVMPDADLDQATDALMGAALRLGRRALHGDLGGGGGRRRRRHADRAAGAARCAALKVAPGTDPEAEMGPLVTARASEQGARLRRSRRGRGREAGGGRPRPEAAGLRGRLLPRRLPVRRRDARHEDLQGRDLRPGAVGGARRRHSTTR